MGNSQLWLRVGYELFAEEGHEGLQVERLARMLGRNKSGFYHYFNDRDVYFEYLVQHHQERVDQIIKDIHDIHSFDPELLNVMIRHRVTIIANMQLLRNRHIRLFEKAFKDTNDKLDHLLLPLWARHMGQAGLPDHAGRLFQYFDLIRDAFYARVTFDTMNYEFLHDHFSKAKSLIDRTAGPETSSFTHVIPLIMNNKRLHLSGV